jgi:3-deoxy-7-phosphoheptulonate synthase
MSAEYILNEGNPNLILCERGIRTFEKAYRNTFDINAIPFLKEKTHLPIFGDPSHATGQSFLVKPISKAAFVAGADGLIIEIHKSPNDAISDGKQSLNFEEFEKLIKEISRLEN